MRNEKKEREALFKRFKDGSPRALQELFAAERADLFDYLMRMTGQVSKSTDTIDELLSGLDDQSLKDIQTYSELRLMLFSTVRRFNSDAWNVDTSRLINAALETDGAGDAARRDRVIILAVDRALRGLGAREREVVILRARARFEFPGVAAIAGIGERQAELSYADALSRLDHECPGAAKLEEIIEMLPNHPEPLRSSQRTINLSMVMNDIKAKPVGLWSPFRLMTLIVLLLLAVSFYVAPETFAKVASAIYAAVTSQVEKL